MVVLSLIGWGEFAGGRYSFADWSEAMLHFGAVSAKKENNVFEMRTEKGRRYQGYC